MLDKIKQWTSKVFDWSSGEGDSEKCLRALHDCLDPRELPRPRRAPAPPTTAPSGSEDSEDEGCCRNCAHLSSQLLECAICLEALSSECQQGVTSCLECGNIACRSCAARLPRCPYCRTHNGLTPNIALQRLLHKLDLPCRNSIVPIRCPYKKCEWKGSVVNLTAHLEESHAVTILNGSSVTLYIAEFQRKAELSESRPRRYSVLLACYSDVFVCKVVLHHHKLKVALSQLTQTKCGHLAAWIEMSCASKIIKGIIPLSKNKSDIEVPISNLMAPGVEACDRVSITVSIRPLS